MSFQEAFDQWLQQDSPQPRALSQIVETCKQAEESVDAGLAVDELLKKFLAPVASIYNEQEKKVDEKHCQAIKIFLECLPVFAEFFPKNDIFNPLQEKIKSSAVKNSGEAVVDTILTIHCLLQGINAEEKESVPERSQPEKGKKKEAPQTWKRRFSSAATLFRQSSGKEKSEKTWRDRVKKTLKTMVDSYGHAFWVAERMILNGDVLRSFFDIHSAKKSPMQQRNMALILAGEPMRLIRYNDYNIDPTPLVEARYYQYQLLRDNKYLENAKKGWETVKECCSEFLSKDSNYHAHVAALVEDEEFCKAVQSKKDFKQLRLELLRTEPLRFDGAAEEAASTTEYLAPQPTPEGYESPQLSKKPMAAQALKTAEYTTIDGDSSGESDNEDSREQRAAEHEYEVVDGGEEYIQVAAEKEEESGDNHSRSSSPGLGVSTNA